MATRATTAEVLEIMDTTLSESELLPYLTSANVFVTQALASSGLSDDTLKEIERWMAAHFAAMTKERQAKEAGAGGAYIKYAGEWGTSLNATTYGQVAMGLDSTNTLANLQKGKTTPFIYAVPGV